MGLKRRTRNLVCWLLAIVLILQGCVKRARHKSFQEGVITPVYFHNPSRKLFLKIVAWLKNSGYVFISSDQLTQILGRKISCPRGAVWLSLDDGWKGNIDNVIPTAIEYNVPITIFIYTSAVEDGIFWWKRVRQSARSLPAQFRSTEAIRKLPEDTRKQILESLNRMEPRRVFSRDAMTVEDIRRISTIPQVTIGSHTVSHPVLPNCTDEQIDYELRESKNKLESWTGKEISTFSYPSGRFDGRERQFLKKYGYRLAATAEKEFAKFDSDCYLLPRTDTVDDASFAENLCHLLGVWGPVVSWVKGIFKREARIDKASLRAESAIARKN